MDDFTCQRGDEAHQNRIVVFPCIVSAPLERQGETVMTWLCYCLLNKERERATKQLGTRSCRDIGPRSNDGERRPTPSSTRMRALKSKPQIERGARKF